VAFMWGTVTGVSPLRVRLDGDTSAVPVTPDSLVDPLTLVADDRVRVELSNNRLVVLGKSGGAGVPSGASMDFAGSVEPAGWFFEDGRSLLRSAYPSLYAAIGTTYGAADVDHFNIPNQKGRVSVTRDPAQTEFDTLGETGGEKKHQLTIGELASHRHNNPIAVVYNGNASANRSSFATNSPFWSMADPNNASAATGGDEPHNNLQPYIVLNTIIKI